MADPASPRSRPSSSKKPRKARPPKPAPAVQTPPPRPLARAASHSHPAPGIPLAALLHPVRHASSQWLVVPIVLMIAFLFRWAVGLGPYSGMAAPPMHGDFEAQRHWMELTTQLPVREWYWHDLQWWGLDYPPLTAYHSWVLGKIGALIDPSWFALHTSRGLDAVSLKTYMRATVAASEYLTFVPAAVVFAQVFGRQAVMSKHEKALALSAILLHPGLLLIDHGHFQYNSVMFGFFLSALDCFLTDHLLWGSFFFVLALGFKQMALYYAPAIFCYLLGLCVFPRPNLPRLLALGAVVVATFAALLAPLYAAGGLEQLAQCARRVFPFARGLFEDKVANFWCAANVAIKFRETYSAATLQRASLAATLAAIAPPCALILANPQKRLLPLAMAGCAWGFFMFSFQVHEKSVLLALVPATLHLAGDLAPATVGWVAWMNTMGAFSLFPLLKRDGLALQYAVVTALWAWLTGAFARAPHHGWPATLVQRAAYAAAAAVHVAELAVGRVDRWPDLWVVLNVLVSFAAFGVAWAWCLWRLWCERGRGAELAEKMKKRV